jgi:translation initiation factor IF-3
MRNERNKEQFRINERINSPEVRLVGENITTGVYPLYKALQMAEDMGKCRL